MATEKETVILEFQVDSKEAVQSIENLTKANKALREERKKLDTSTEEGKSKIAAINAEIDKNTAVIKANSSTLEKNRLNVGNYTESINKSKAAVGGFGDMINKVGKYMATFFSVGLILSWAKDAIGTISAFEKKMDEVQAIVGASDGEFKKLRESALKLGESTRYTAEQVAELQIAYGRLGFSASEILKVTEATLDLATATGEDLAKSADIAGSTLRGFGLDAGETTKVVDVMAKSFNSSALGLDNFGEAMKYVAPVAAQAGLSLEQTTAMLGVLADAGIRGSQAGTSLRKIISDLGQGAAPELTKRLGEMSQAGLTGAQAMDEVGRTAYASLLVLANHTEKVDAATEAYMNANGEAKKMAAIMEDNLTGDWEKFTGAIEGAVLKGSSSIPFLRKITQGLTDVVTVMGSENLSLLEKFWATMGLGSVQNAKQIDELRIKAKEKAEEERAYAEEQLIQNALQAENFESYMATLEGLGESEQVLMEIRRLKDEQTTAAAKKEAQLAIEEATRKQKQLEAHKKEAEEKKKTDAEYYNILYSVQKDQDAKEVALWDAERKREQDLQNMKVKNIGDLQSVIKKAEEEDTAAKAAKIEWEKKSELEKFDTIFKAFMRKHEREISAINEGLQIASDVLGDVQKLYQEHYKLQEQKLEISLAKQKTAIQTEFETEKKLLDDKFAAGEISKEEYDKDIKALNEKFQADTREAEIAQQNELNAIKKKAFDANKKMSIAMALIDAGMAFLKALASLPPPANYVVAAATAVVAAVQVNQIKKQEFVPTTFAEGGYTGDGGKYDEAGTVHKGEFVMPQSSVKKYGRETFQSYLDGSVATNGMMSGASGGSQMGQMQVYLAYKEFKDFENKMEMKANIVEQR